MSSLFRRITLTTIGLVLASAVGSAVPALAATTASSTTVVVTTTSYETELFRALATCQAKLSNPDDPAALTRCVGDLAAPNPRSAYEVDLFRAFTNCLSEAASLDSPYPGIDDAEVNACMGL
jgi:hypothetical protein